MKKKKKNRRKRRRWKKKKRRRRRRVATQGWSFTFYRDRCAHSTLALAVYVHNVQLPCCVHFLKKFNKKILIKSTQLIT